MQSLLRDLALCTLIIYVILQWQGRNLLDDDGSKTIENQTLLSLKGTSSRLFPLSPERSKNTLFSFFAPWCNVCALSIYNLAGINEQSVNILRIALDYTSLSEVQSFITENKVLGEILLYTTELKSYFNIIGYPTYYMLDSEQRIVAGSMGYTSTLGLKLTEFSTGRREAK